MKPHPYQEAAIEHLLKVLPKHRAALNGSDTGTGKTLVAVETMRRLGNPATLVICPKPVMPGWERTAAAQGTELTVINYEMLRTGRTPFGEWNPLNGKFRFRREVEFLIFDEVHRCKGADSQTGELLCSAARAGIPTLAMSATPADSPLEMKGLGMLLGLHKGERPKPTLSCPEPLSFAKWNEAHGCCGIPKGFYGSDEVRRAHMEKIHKAIYPEKGVRVRIADLGSAFPETQITAELYAMDDPARIDALHAQMVDAMAALHSRTENYKGSDPMTELLAARQEIELLKVPIFTELAREAESAGMSVVIFVNFRATVRELCSRLDTDCFIDGSQVGERGAKQREANRLRLQNDESRFLIGTADSAGAGLDAHDVTGKHPRLALHSPGYNAKTVRQQVGRVQREGGKSKSLQRFIFADGTCEVPLHKKLAGKLNNMDTLQDGDLVSTNLEITNRL